MLATKETWRLDISCSEGEATWSSGPKMNTRRYWHSSSVLGSKLFVFGGCEGRDKDSIQSPSTIEVVDVLNCGKLLKAKWQTLHD